MINTINSYLKLKTQKREQFMISANPLPGNFRAGEGY